jgi:hypothetical protein
MSTILTSNIINIDRKKYFYDENEVSIKLLEEVRPRLEGVSVLDILNNPSCFPAGDVIYRYNSYVISNRYNVVLWSGSKSDFFLMQMF